MLAVDAFDDFSEFVESISCETSSCQVPVVRIHAGEPVPGFNNFTDGSALELIDAVIAARRAWIRNLEVGSLSGRGIGTRRLGARREFGPPEAPLPATRLAGGFELSN